MNKLFTFLDRAVGFLANNFHLQRRIICPQLRRIIDVLMTTSQVERRRNLDCKSFGYILAYKFFISALLKTLIRVFVIIRSQTTSFPTSMSRVFWVPVL